MALSYPKWTAQFKPSFLLDIASVDSPCQSERLLRCFHHGDVHHGALIGHRRGAVTFRLLHRRQETLIIGNVRRCRGKDLVHHWHMRGMDHDLTAVTQLAVQPSISA